MNSDKDNRINDDDAFVFSDTLSDADSIVSVTGHEIGYSANVPEYEIISDALSAPALTITQSGTLKGISLECGSSVSDSENSYSFSVNVPMGQIVTVTVNSNLLSMINCSQANVKITVDGKSVDKSSFTLTKTSTISLYVTSSVTNPDISTYYAKFDVSVNSLYSFAIPQADLNPIALEGYSDALIITADANSKTHQSTFTTDDTLYLTGFYINSGTITSAAFNYVLKINGQITAIGSDSGLSANTADIIKWNLGKLSPGEYTITLELDAGNTVNESDESNNTITKTITVKDAALPDLKISAVQLPANITDHHLYDISVTVSNTGRTQAGTFTVQCFDDTEKIGELTIDSLDSGAEITQALTIQPGTLTSGVHNLKFVVDSADAIDETNENNNIYLDELTVTAAKNLPVNPSVYSYALSGDLLLLSWNSSNISGGGYQLMFQTENGSFTTPVTVTGNSFSIEEPEKYTSWQIRGFTSDRLFSDWSLPVTYYIYDRGSGTGNVFSFETANAIDNVVYTFDDYKHELHIISDIQNQSGFDTYALPHGVIKALINVGWHSSGNALQKYWEDELTIISNGTEDELPEKFTSTENGNFDIFLGNASGTWEHGFFAQHVGEKSTWTGFRQEVQLFGKHKITDIFEGSADANVLILTDDSNGDAIFLDDIYSALGDQARLSQIKVIQAGGGDDVVDLTSQRYQSTCTGIKIYGGDGDDTIWASSGANTLYGDAGNDNLIGGSGNDLIIGGSGDDVMNGGGGDDEFTFGSDWGNDIVTQVADGTVRLWFDTGSIDNWNAETMTYQDGSNSVIVTGVSVDNIILEFGNEGGTNRYDTYRTQGAFDSAVSGVNVTPWKTSPY